MRVLVSKTTVTTPILNVINSELISIVCRFLFFGKELEAKREEVALQGVKNKIILAQMKQQIAEGNIK